MKDIIKVYLKHLIFNKLTTLVIISFKVYKKLIKKLN